MRYEEVSENVFVTFVQRLSVTDTSFIASVSFSSETIYDVFNKALRQAFAGRIGTMRVVVQSLRLFQRATRLVASSPTSTARCSYDEEKRCSPAIRATNRQRFSDEWRVNLQSGSEDRCVIFWITTVTYALLDAMERVIV